MSWEALSKVGTIARLLRSLGRNKNCVAHGPHAAHSDPPPPSPILKSGFALDMAKGPAGRLLAGGGGGEGGVLESLKSLHFKTRSRLLRFG